MAFKVKYSGEGIYSVIVKLKLKLTWPRLKTDESTRMVWFPMSESGGWDGTVRL